MSLTNNKKLKLIISAMLFYWVLPCGIGMTFWPAFHANYQRNGQTEENGPLTPGIKWKFKGPDNDAAVVVGSDGIIYVNGRNILHAIYANGKEKWRYQYSGRQISIPSIGPDGTVYIAGVNEKGYLIALHKDSGAVKWSAEVGPYHLEAEGLSPIAITSTGRVYVAMGNSLSAFNAAGVREWMYQLPPNFFTPTAPSLSSDEKTVYVYQRTGGGLYAVNRDGALKWHDSSTYYSDFSSPAVAPDGTIYLLDNAEANLHAITPEGKKKWTARFPGKHLAVSNAAIGRDGTVYVDIANDANGMSGGAIYAINPKHGKVKWKFEIKDGYVGAIIAVDARGNLYYVDGNGNIYCLKQDGSLVWKYAVGKEYEFFYSAPAIFDETLYVVDEKTGVLFAIGGKPNK